METIKKVQSIPPKLEHVMWALRRHSIFLIQQDASKKSFKDLTVEGMFLNSLTDIEERAIPVLSPLRLFQWAFESYPSSAQLALLQMLQRYFHY